MATTTCGTCSKIVLFMVNFVFWLSGIAVLGMGIWVSIDRNTMEFLKLFDQPLFRYLGFGMIGIGGFVTILGFIGCFGACHESKCLLWMYLVCIFFLLLAEIVCMALLFAYTDEVKIFLKTKLNESFVTHYTVEKTGIREAVDTLQAVLMCCGNTNFTDWQQSEWYKVAKSDIVYNTSVPDSCCVPGKNSEGYQHYGGCQDRHANPNNYRWKRGCFSALYTTFEEYVWFIGGVGIGIAVLQLLLMVVTVFLLRNLTDDYD